MSDFEQGNKVLLGKKYRDTIHGIEGIATSQTRYLTGCDHVGIEFLDKDKEVKTRWVDITRLEVVDEEEPALAATHADGGPASHPPGHGGP